MSSTDRNNSTLSLAWNIPGDSVTPPQTRVAYQGERFVPTRTRVRRQTPKKRPARRQNHQLDKPPREYYTPPPHRGPGQMKVGTAKLPERTYA